MSLRVRGGLYDKLKFAADTSERTISEEMEKRLELSFTTPAADDSPTSWLLKSIAAVVRSAEASTGHGWQDDPVTAELAGDLAHGIIKVLLPAAPVVENKLLKAAGAKQKPEDPEKAARWAAAVERIARDETDRQLEALAGRPILK